MIVNVDSWDGGPDAPGWPLTTTFAAAPLVEALKPGGLLYIENHAGQFGSDQFLRVMEKLYPSLKVLKGEAAVDPDFELRQKLPVASQWEWPVSKPVAIFIAQKVADTRR